MVRSVALLLTFLTGFSGLVYEVAWQRYLGTLLGSHSEATAAVLAIFLGGLSLGYWVFGRATRAVLLRAETAGTPPRLLALYGSLELGIGLYVFAFPWLFKGVQVLSYSFVHGTTGLGFAFDVLLSALLIGPPSVLMGGTIPILTQGLSRSLEDATRFHAFVYAFNTAGAFVGALAAGFYLIPALGLQGVMTSMGVINLAAGAIFLGLGRRGREVVSLEVSGEASEGKLGRADFHSYVAVALLTGFAMMVMQTTIIRIGALAFGSSQFTFSMVVAVFVLAIALGSFAVSAFSRIPSWLVWCNQWALAGVSLLLYLRIDEAPYWVLLVRTLFRETNAGFAGYYFLGLLLLLAVIGPAVLLSGAALPLLFHQMRRQAGHLGDLAGTLYSWNTVGSLAGALLGGYVLLFWLDLHHIYRIAVAALVLAATLLTLRIQKWRLVYAAAAFPILIAVAALPPWRVEILNAGLFRDREIPSELYQGAEALLAERIARSPVIRHADGPTSSVVVRETSNPKGRRSLGIATDGKRDGDSAGDFDTAAFAAVLPALMADKAERAFVIGWGLGITAGELGSYEEMKEVVVAEISHEVAAAGPLFDFASQKASQNPKIRIIEADAYRALMRQDQTYDIIVSAPSHLWVTGVEMLFSREFLEAARDRLSPGGVHCQYVHRYEIDDESIELVLRNYAAVYDHVSVWEDRHDSMFFLGFQNPRWAADHFRLEQRAAEPDLRATLKRMGLGGFSQLLARELLPLGVLHTLDLEGPVHSLYHPRLNDVAARAFFRNDFGSPPFSGYGQPAEIGRRNSLLGNYIMLKPGGLDDAEYQQAVFGACNTVGPQCNALLAQWLRARPDSPLGNVSARALEKNTGGPPRERIDEVAELLSKPSRAAPKRPADLERAERATQDFIEFYSHAAPFEPTALVDIWSRCRTGARSEATCRAMVQTRDEAELGASFEERVQDCMRPKEIPEACREGLERARRIVAGQGT